MSLHEASNTALKGPRLKRKSRRSSRIETGTGKPLKKVTTIDRHRWWISTYASQNYGIWIQCCKCKKWRHVLEYEEAHQVPELWFCSMNKDETMNRCSIPEEEPKVKPTDEEYVPGSIVWAKMGSYPWWPAIVEDDPDCEIYCQTDKRTKKLAYHVTFLGGKATRAWVSMCYLRPFLKRLNIIKPSTKKKEILALHEEAQDQAVKALSMTLPERLKKYSFAFRYRGKGLTVYIETEDSHPADAVLQASNGSA